MKQHLKRAVSLVTAIFMIMSIVPVFAAATVTAGTNENMVWFEESFDNATIQATLNSGSKQYADISTDSSQVKDSGDDMAYKMISTANTASSGGFGGLATTKLNEGKNSELFTISYRIKFENAQKAVALGSFRSEGGLARMLVWDAGGSVAVDGNEYKVDNNGNISFAGAVLSTGWNDIAMVYNTTTRTAAIVVNDVCVTTDSVANYAANGFKGITIAPTATADIYIDDIVVKDSAIYINGLDENYLATENVEFEVVLPEDFETASVISGGKKITEITKTDGVNCYNVSVGCDELAQGENDITVEAVYKSGKRTATKTINVIANSDGAMSWKQDMSGYTESMTDASAVSAALGLNGINLQNVATLTRSAGLGGKAKDDVSIGFANNTTEYSSAWAFFDKNVAASSGKVSISFDVYDGCGNGNQKDKLLIQGEGNSDRYQIISISAQVREWTTVNVEIDLDKGTYTLTDNFGTTNGTFSLTSISNLRFRACIYANNGIPVSYDNIKVMAYDDEQLTATVKGYKTADLDLTVQTTVPAGVDVILEANKDITAVSGKVLKSDGTEVEGTSLSVNGKEITVKAELAPGTYTVVLDKDTTVGTTKLGTNVKIPVTVTNEIRLQLVDNKITDKKFTAKYYTIGARPWIIAASYKGTELQEIKSTVAETNLSDISFEFTSDFDSVTIFTFDSKKTLVPLNEKIPTSR